MAGGSGVDWYKRVTTAAAVIGVVVGVLLLLLGRGWFFDYWYNIPNVVYTVQPQRVLESSSFGGLVVENRGRATANRVLIKLGDLGCAIEQHGVQSDELWELVEGGTGHSTVTILLDRLTSGSRVSISILTSGRGRYDNVVVTTNEGRGRPATEDVATIAMTTLIAVGVTIVVVVVGLIAVLVWRNRQGLASLLSGLRRTAGSREGEGD